MLTSARLTLALLPALAYAQVYPQTAVVTHSQCTVTETLQSHVATRTIIITAPVDEITSIADSIPKSVQLVQTEAPGGQILPITVNSFVTSILIPAAASIPTGITLAPISPVLVPVPTVDASIVSQVNSVGPSGSLNAEASSKLSAVASKTAEVRASITSKVAVVIDSATSVASAARSEASAAENSAGSVIASISSGAVLPSPLIPVPVNPSSIFQSVASGLSSEISSRVSQATAELVATSAVVTSVISGVTSEIVVATSVARSKVASEGADLSSILSDSSSAVRATSKPVTTPTSLVTQTSTASTKVSLSTTATETSTSSEESSSSSSTQSASSTAAPQNSGARTGRVEELVLGLVVGAIGWLMI